MINFLSDFEVKIGAEKHSESFRSFCKKEFPKFEKELIKKSEKCNEVENMHALVFFNLLFNDLSEYFHESAEKLSEEFGVSELYKKSLEVFKVVGNFN